MLIFQGVHPGRFNMEPWNQVALEDFPFYRKPRILRFAWCSSSGGVHPSRLYISIPSWSFRGRKSFGDKATWSFVFFVGEFPLEKNRGGKPIWINEQPFVIAEQKSRNLRGETSRFSLLQKRAFPRAAFLVPFLVQEPAQLKRTAWHWYHVRRACQGFKSRDLIRNSWQIRMRFPHIPIDRWMKYYSLPTQMIYNSCFLWVFLKDIEITCFDAPFHVRREAFGIPHNTTIFGNLRNDSWSLIRSCCRPLIQNSGPWVELESLILPRSSPSQTLRTNDLWIFVQHSRLAVCVPFYAPSPGQMAMEVRVVEVTIVTGSRRSTRLKNAHSVYFSRYMVRTIAGAVW